jgi:hypothetical protein
MDLGKFIITGSCPIDEWSLTLIVTLERDEDLADCGP